MISLVKGKVKEISHQTITVDINGLGLSVGVTDEHVYSIGQDAELQIYFHWNQENGPQLFGFSSLIAKSVFMLIISCSGIGPKIGLAVLSQMTPEQFLQAITLADSKALSSISGIGPKKAELMIMQLRDKASKITPKDMHSIEGATLSNIKQVSDALSSLNYSRSEINDALEYVKKNMPPDADKFDQLLRKALSFLAKRV